MNFHAKSFAGNGKSLAGNVHNRDIVRDICRDIGGEHPDVILRDVASRRRPNGHVIVFANEKGGVGKSTLGFHTAVALANAGRKVAVIDLDHSQATLSQALVNRGATGRLLKVDLPLPRHVRLTQQSGALLSQEIARIGSDCSHVLIDVAGGDSPIARRAIAMADTLVTPVNTSFADLDLLGQFDATTMRLKRLGHFAQVAMALRGSREALGIAPADWVVMQNRYRRTGSSNDVRFSEALRFLARKAGFRLGQGLGERVAYRELFLFGLTHLDLKLIPGLAKTKPAAKSEIDQLIVDLQLPRAEPRHPELFDRIAPAPVKRAAVREAVPA